MSGCRTAPCRLAGSVQTRRAHYRNFQIKFSETAMPDQSDRELFLKEVGGIERLKQDRVPAGRRKAGDRESLARKRQAAEQGSLQEESLGFTTGYVEEIAPEGIISIHDSGVQERVLRSLRRGDLRPERRLDLHNHTLEQARLAVMNFISSSVLLGIRTVIIVHGKGEFSSPRAFLKSHVASWLAQSPDVIAAETAAPRDGGYGAVYVLLRKRS